MVETRNKELRRRVGLNPWADRAVQIYSNGYGKNIVFVMNQLGGVGAGKSMFNGRYTQVDGVKSPGMEGGPTKAIY